METKPRGRVYWTAKHNKHDEAGVLVIGRTVIPMVLIYISSLVIGVLLTVYGLVFSEKNDAGKIADGAAFLPLAWYGAFVALIFLIVVSVLFIRWIARILKEAQSGLDKSRWDY